MIHNCFISHRLIYNLFDQFSFFPHFLYVGAKTYGEVKEMQLLCSYELVYVHVYLRF